MSRRNNLLEYSIAEHAIRNAMLEVEKLPAHPTLTTAVIKLQESQSLVADYLEIDSGANDAKWFPKNREALVDLISRRLAAIENVKESFIDSVVYVEHLKSGISLRRHPRLDRGESTEGLSEVPYYVWTYGYQAEKIVSIIEQINLLGYNLNKQDK